LARRRDPQDRPDWSPGVIVVQQFTPLRGPRDWAAEKAEDKDFVARFFAPPGTTCVDLYTVPSGKLLLVAECQVSNEFEGEAYLADTVRGTFWRLYMPEKSFLSVVFTKPKPVTAGATLRACFFAWAAEGIVTIALGCWEVSLE